MWRGRCRRSCAGPSRKNTSRSLRRPATRTRWRHRSRRYARRSHTQLAASTKYLLAAAGTTGNNTGSSVTPADHTNAQVAFQFVVEAAGATPTVTFKYQGSLDGLTWTDVPYIPANTNTSATATQTVTGVGTTVNFLDINSGARQFSQFRVVTSANTNITYRAELYVFSGNSW